MAERPKTRKRRKARPASQAIAFRLPKDVVDRLDAAADAKHLSRNKMVELVLRESLKGFKPVEAARAGSIDLFA